MKRKIDLSTIKNNDRNPRRIKDEAFERLCESITRDPDFMPLRPIVIDDNNVVIGGNMRLRACLHLGMKQVDSSWVIKASKLTDEQKKRFTIIDNSPAGIAGEWDFDILSADYDIPELEELGLMIPELYDGDMDEFFNESDGEQEGDGKETKVCPHCGKEI